MRKLTAVIKTTTKCNLGCGYCYAAEEKKTDMGQETLENVIKQLMGLENLSGIRFIWHGGEPLLMGLNFFKRAVELQTKNHSGIEVGNSMQTNATLLNEQWLDFFEAYNFRIGVSLDGPRDVTNLTRYSLSGDGAFEDINKGIKLLQQRTKIQSNKKTNIFGGIIAIIGRHNIDHTEELYNFFREFGVRVKFNPIVDHHKRECNELSITPKEYGAALINLFDLWYNDSVSYTVEPISQMVNALKGKPMGICTFLNTCRNTLISIGPDGSVYPCSRSMSIEDLKLGNINENNLHDIIFSPKHAYMGMRSNSSIENHNRSSHQELGFAGCMLNAYLHTGNIFSRDPFCESYEMVFEHIKDRLAKEKQVVGGK